MTGRLVHALAGLCGTLALTATTSATDLNVHVDLRKKEGPAPYTYRAGVFLNSLPVGYPKDTFLAEQRPGMVEFSWDFYNLLLNAGTEEEFFSRLPGSNLTAWVKDTAAAGGEPYIRLMPVPRWLWSGGNGARKPPRDWEGWERFVERIVSYYNNQLHIDVRYIVWDEPDLAWDGNTEEFLRLYRHAAAGLLRANPKARIGGPAPAAFNAAIGKNGPPLLPAFVRYCANTAIPGLARRLPLDILVWHTFDAPPVSPGAYELEVQAARKLLEENGYRDGVELNLGSWAALASYPGIGNERDSPFLGAFVVSSVIAMTKAGVNRHAFFNLFEDWRRNRDEFSNDMGLTTRNFVFKPGYYASSLLSRLQGTHVATTVADPFVQAAAAQDGDTLRIVVANFAPPVRMLRALAGRRLTVQGHTRQEVKSLVSEMDELLRDRRRIEAWNGPAEMRKELLALHDTARLSSQRQQEPVRLQITLDGLATGRYRVQEYRVDGSSGNAVARRDMIEQALRGAMQEGNAAAKEYLAKRLSASDRAQLKEGKGELGDRLRQLPAERQQEVREAMEARNEVALRKVKEINAAVRPTPKALPELQANGAVSLRTDLPPYGVVLIEAERRN